MIIISLGSNKGNRLENLHKGIFLLKENGFTITYLSPVLETKAILPKEPTPSSWDKPYFNMIVGGATALSPEDLLKKLQKIEKILGRSEKAARWAPRTLDLDILFWEDSCYQSESLTIPHKEFLNRDFLIHLMGMGFPRFLYPEETSSFYRHSMAEIAHKKIKTKSSFLNSFSLNPRLVGILNITPDSFSDGGLFNTSEKAFERVLALFQEGASVIDIGAQSTRPTAERISPIDEWNRLEPLIMRLQNYRSEDLTISIDTFFPEIIEQVLSIPCIHWINDVSDSIPSWCLKKIAYHDKTIVAMHSLGIPPSPDNVLPHEEKPIFFIKEWAMKKINFLKTCGFEKERIIIDPGLGFGKTLYQNLSILQDIQELKTLGVSILVGHSRKSFITALSQKEAKERDIETLAYSSYLSQAGIDYIRVHNVGYHQRFFTSLQNYI